VASGEWQVASRQANPGCEITALVNLLLPAEKRLHSPARFMILFYYSFRPRR
jgi:hypothetical protein